MSLFSAEIRGQFRTFYKKLEMEIPLVMGAMKRCEKEVLYLARRRRLSVGSQRALAQHWRAVGQEQRFAFAGPVTTPDGKTVFVDLRPSTSELLLDKWRNSDWERNICIMQFALTLSSKRTFPEELTSVSLTPLATASSHALCRRVQRGGGSMLEAARDLQAVRPWAEISASMGLRHFVAPTTHGFWRVELILVNDENMRPTFDACCRTWISGDDTYDPSIDDRVCRLRSLGSGSDQARIVLRELSATYDRQPTDWANA